MQTEHKPWCFLHI